MADLQKIRENRKTFDSRVLCELGDFAGETIFRNRRNTEGAHRPLLQPSPRPKSNHLYPPSGEGRLFEMPDVG